MDWLKSMNDMVTHIEANLHESIAYEQLARGVGCSVYEFFRVFSFMTGVSLGEYIRRRRLSRAAFALQNSDEKVIDIALAVGYESPSSFATAFKELHGVTPTEARKAGVPLKSYPPISFQLTIKGVEVMDFRIEKREAFSFGSSFQRMDVSEDLSPPSLASWFAGRRCNCEKCQSNWRDWGYSGTEDDMRTVPFGTSATGYWLAAFDFHMKDGKFCFMMGNESSNEACCCRQEFPAATWIVFSFSSKMNEGTTNQAYARILTEWFPDSGYKRDETIPHMERFPIGEDATNRPWEIWIPVVQS